MDRVTWLDLPEHTCIHTHTHTHTHRFFRGGNRQEMGHRKY